MMINSRKGSWLGRCSVLGFFRVLCLAGLIMGLSSPSFAGRIKDLAEFSGVRENQLVGYGVVVGLNGTGDGAQALFTTRGLANVLDGLGMQVDARDLKVKNVAGVMVTASLPAFVKPGQKVDVLLSSLGDARSLSGGTLIATPLRGLDGEVYAMAQGPLVIGVSGRGSHLTAARIPAGASVERSVPVALADEGKISLSLSNPDFTTMERMVRAIDGLLNGQYARARDGATVDITVPEQFKGREVSLMAELEKLEITPDQPARVILDERTGTVVMGADIRIGRIALSRGNLSLRIGGAGGAGSGKVMELAEGTSLGEVVKALNSIGANPADLVAIFQSIKAAGALQAELQII